jgi:hypothetical protein
MVTIGAVSSLMRLKLILRTLATNVVGDVPLCKSQGSKGAAFYFLNRGWAVFIEVRVFGGGVVEAFATVTT